MLKLKLVKKYNEKNIRTLVLLIRYENNAGRFRVNPFIEFLTRHVDSLNAQKIRARRLTRKTFLNRMRNPIHLIEVIDKHIYELILEYLIRKSLIELDNTADIT